MQAPASGLAQALGLGYPSFLSSASSSPSLDEATAQSEQQKAIRVLLPHHDDSILAYLRYDRSLYQNGSGHGSLSNDQVLAVRALSHYDDDEIRTWLGQARKICETAALLFGLTRADKH